MALSIKDKRAEASARELEARQALISPRSGSIDSEEVRAVQDSVAALTLADARTDKESRTDTSRSKTRSEPIAEAR